MLRSKSAGTLLVQNLFSREARISQEPRCILLWLKLTFAEPGTEESLLHTREPPQPFLRAITDRCLEGVTKERLYIKQFFHCILNVYVTAVPEPDLTVNHILQTKHHSHF